MAQLEAAEKATLEVKQSPAKKSLLQELKEEFKGSSKSSVRQSAQNSASKRPRTRLSQ